VQAHTYAGRVLVVVDDARLLRGQLEHVMNGADTDGHASRSRRNSTTPRYELRQISGSPTITRRSHVLVAVNSKSTSPRSGLPGSMLMADPPAVEDNDESNRR
jgi:hypothetical protein